MKFTTKSSALTLLAAASVEAAPPLFARDQFDVHHPRMVARDVYTNYPYTGPAIPVGDWADQSPQGNGKGFPRLVEPPAVKPASKSPTNNINVISFSYMPGGINIHFQTPFGLTAAPTVLYGTKKNKLNIEATGTSATYDRTPPCSIMPVTQCNQFFHDVPITGLLPGTTYYYHILASNGTTKSPVMQFTTGRAAGVGGSFSVAVLNDMGYTNAGGTMNLINEGANDGTYSFAWHGGDLSYADDWYSGVLPCQLTGEDSWPVCYNGTSSVLPPGDFPADYKIPLPEGEIANQGSPNGGDMSVIYESNWDLWQQWMNPITQKIPYMTIPGNHEASCMEFDGGANIMTAYMNDDIVNGSSPTSELTYYSCPPSQRNFTAYQFRFKNPGDPSIGRGNMWYSFDYGLAHFISFDSETDFVKSPEYPFARDVTGNETLPTEDETYVTDAGPFGAIDNGQITNITAYEQVQWMKDDLAAVNRTKTPWVIAIAHRPMYSTQTASYQANIRNSFQSIMLAGGVDLFFAGHIHWYERMYPVTANGTVDSASVINNSTYRTNPGVSMTHIVNGQAGNIESHSTTTSPLKPYTAVLDQEHYGFSKLSIANASSLTVQFMRGDGAGVSDQVTLLKK